MAVTSTSHSCFMWKVKRDEGHRGKEEEEEGDEKVVKSHIQSTEDEISKLCQDFKVEEMFSPVETSNPTKPGRNEGEIQMTPTTKKNYMEMTPGKWKAFQMGYSYALKQSVIAKGNDCSNVNTETSDNDSDSEEETRSERADKQPSECSKADDCQELSQASDGIEYNSHITGAIGVTQRVPKEQQGNRATRQQGQQGNKGNKGNKATRATMATGQPWQTGQQGNQSNKGNKG
ncbi:unnamed protein product, partial [Porites lobata]